LEQDLLRKIVAALIVVPLAVVIIAFAVANRQTVTVSFDPLDPSQPAYAMAMWLFVPIFAALILGVIIGGSASWLRHGRWRRAARRLEREASELRARFVALQGAAAEPSIVPREQTPPPRLKLRPPAQQ
jgi:uncharacterized integral membrane protein